MSDPACLQFGLRLRFRLSHRLNGDPPGIDIDQFPEMLRIEQLAAGQHGSTQWIVLRSDGFADKAAAQHAGRSLANAVRVSPLLTNLSVDLGANRATFSIARHVREAMEDKAARNGQPLKVMGNVHGLEIFACDPPPFFPSMAGTGTVSAPVADWTGHLKGLIDRDLHLTPKQIVALDVFNSAAFELSLRARIVGLVTVIEALASQRSLDTDTRALVKEFKEKVNCSGAQDAQLLRNQLDRLNKVSIAEATRSFLRDGRASHNDLRVWGDCYTLRSRMLHDGDAPSDLVSPASKLGDLVRGALLRDLGLVQEREE